MKKQTDNEYNRKIENLIDVSLSRLKSMIDVDCVMGQPQVMPDGSTIIPVSKVSMGFVCGAGEYNDLSVKRQDAEYPLTTGIGGGFTVSPIGFFVTDGKKYKLISIDKSGLYSTLIKNVTDLAKKIMEEKNEK